MHMRTDGFSSLDFTYWILETVEENYQSVTSDAVFIPTAESDLMHTTIVDCALACGVTTPRTFDALMAKVARYGTSTSPEEAMSTRGAVLHRKGVLTVSVGDDRRLVGIDTDGAISIYRTMASERAEGYWDGAFLVPELRYL